MAEKPDLSGEITDFEQNRIGSIALWKNKDRGEKNSFGARMKFPKNWKLDSFSNAGY